MGILEKIYRYFVQPQIDVRTQSIFGYELLLKQWTEAGWRVPASFLQVDLAVMSRLLVATTKILGLKVQYVSVNVNREQLMDTQMVQAILQSQKQLYPAKLTVELTEETSTKTFADTVVIPQLRRFVEHGMQVSLDDVGTGNNDYQSIRDFLPLASEMKFALQNFRVGIQDPQIQEKLRVWHAISREYDQRLILEGIETADGAALSDRFGIPLRQGYYYGKPELLRLAGDPLDFTQLTS